MLGAATLDLAANDCGDSSRTSCQHALTAGASSASSVFWDLHAEVPRTVMPPIALDSVDWANVVDSAVNSAAEALRMAGTPGDLYATSRHTDGHT